MTSPLDLDALEKNLNTAQFTTKRLPENRCYSLVPESSLIRLETIVVLIAELRALRTRNERLVAAVRLDLEHRICVCNNFRRSQTGRCWTCELKAALDGEKPGEG